MTLVDRTRAALTRAADVYRGSGFDGRIAEVRERLDEPLRVAIAGRVKSGKSTLLNALVADRLAPTDAGECTRIVTWYRDGHTYRVTLHPRTGEPRQLRFTRDDGAIEVDLGGTRPEDAHSLDITWPSQALRRATLIDTPGIGSLSERVTRRAWELLAPDDEETPADAVLYLMRHLHANDLEFLHAFHDTEVSRPNPVNAIGVLSRADEIGVGRLDAMASARRIANRLAGDANVRRVVQTVVPVAGLLAETAATLTEERGATPARGRGPRGQAGRGAVAHRGPVRQHPARAGADLDRARGAAGPVRPLRHPAGQHAAAPGRARPPRPSWPAS